VNISSSFATSSLGLKCGSILKGVTGSVGHAWIQSNLLGMNDHIWYVHRISVVDDEMGFSSCNDFD
jgi:hypothetical protein